MENIQINPDNALQAEHLTKPTLNSAIFEDCHENIRPPSEAVTAFSLVTFLGHQYFGRFRAKRFDLGKVHSLEEKALGTGLSHGVECGPE